MIFEFYWAWYEDYQPHILEGKEKTQEEFEADCKKALRESFDDYLANVGDAWAGLPEWTEAAVLKMQNYGYTIVYPMKFGYCGLDMPKTDRYSEEDNDVELKEYENDFPDFLEEIKKIIEHNDVVDLQLHKHIYKEVEKESNQEE